MSRFVKIVLLGLVCIAGLLVYPVISHPYFFVCPDGSCRYDATRLVAFYKARLGFPRALTAKAYEDRLKRGTYYRLVLNLSHTDRRTGEVEPLRIDVVLTCSTVAMSADGTVMSEGSNTPASFIEPTADGGAVAVAMPNICGGPDKFFRLEGDPFTSCFPHVVWFDDVRDMRMGIGYLTLSGYDSGKSQLAFHDCSIASASYVDWKDWRAARLASFRPTGQVESPWGVSNAGDEPENWHGRNGGKSQFTGKRRCGYYARVRLPESIRANVRAHWPASRPTFWTVFDAGFADPADDNEWLTDTATGEIFRTWNYSPEPSYFPDRLHHWTEWQVEFYPRDSAGADDNIAHLNSVRFVEFTPEWQGLTICGGRRYTSTEEMLTSSDVDQTGIYIKGTRLNWFHEGRSTETFYERDDYIWISGRIM